MPNNVETEVKYKVSSLPDNLPAPYEFRQIYFNGSKVLDLVKEIFPTLDYNLISTYRVRKVKQTGVRFILTLKTKSIGYSRGEFEQEISEELFNKLIDNNIESEIIKNRYVIKKNGYIFEFDEFLNLKTKLITCEVELEEINIYELQNIEEILANDFKLEFTNVTADARYRNSNLVKYLAISKILWFEKF